MPTAVTVWRVLLLCMNLVSIVVLINRYRLYNREWAVETLDYWWTLLLWSFAGVVFATQGLWERRALTATLIFITLATLAVPIGLRRKSIERRDEN